MRNDLLFTAGTEEEEERRIIKGEETGKTSEREEEFTLPLTCVREAASIMNCEDEAEICRSD